MTEKKINDILDMYNQYGYVCNELQLGFLQKYAFAEIKYKHPFLNVEMCLRINPIEAQNDLSMDVVDEYNTFFKDDLLVIGDIEKENSTVFLSSKGVIYTAYDDCVIDWGKKFDLFVEKLRKGQKGELYIIE